MFFLFYLRKIDEMSFSHLSASSISMSEARVRRFNYRQLHNSCALAFWTLLCSIQRGSSWEKIDLQTRACDAAQRHHPFWSRLQFYIRMHHDKPPHAPVSLWICNSFIAEHVLLWDIKRKFQFRIHIIFFSVVFHVAVQIHSIVTSRCLFCGMKIIFTWIKKKVCQIQFFPPDSKNILEIWGEKSYGISNENLR